MFHVPAHKSLSAGQVVLSASRFVANGGSVLDCSPTDAKVLHRPIRTVNPASFACALNLAGLQLATAYAPA